MNPEKKSDKEVEKLKAQLRRREEENVGLSKKIDSMESEIKDLSEENRDLKEVINRAKDISPWSRPNRDNVRRLAKKACLDIVKAPGGWVVKMGLRLGKKFKCLRDIWLILTREEWNLHNEFFPYEERGAHTADAPALSTPCTNRTPQEHNQIEVLRAEWRLFPSMRSVLEEQMAKFGIVPELT